MEHWWGNKWRRIAGWINDHGTQKIKMTYGQSDGSTVSGYNMDGNGYITIPNASPNGKSGSYISGILFSDYGLIPKTANGSATTYYTDILFFDNAYTCYAIVGGYAREGYKFGIGAFCSGISDIHSYHVDSICASISCKPLANPHTLEIHPIEVV